jgi:hypothetical protein
MAFEPILPGEMPNLVDVTKRMDPDGTIADIAEILQQYNPILEDIPLVEGNLPTGHRTTVRADVPEPTWRKLNYGVRPTKSRTTQIDETIGMLEDYGEVDKDLAMLNGNTAAFRLSEDVGHLEGMSNDMAATVFYGDTSVNPERFLGLSPRYDVIGTPSSKPPAEVNSEYLKHVIDAGGTSSGNLTSLWYVVWGSTSVHGIYPQGSQAGLLAEDLGEQTLLDENGGRFQGFRTHYQWKMGLCVRDWRYVVRIANIDLGQMEDGAAQKSLYHAMIKARYTTPLNNMGRGVFYASPAIHAMLDIAAVEKENAALGYTEVFGKEVLSFRGVAIRPCSAILETEVQLT